MDNPSKSFLPCLRNPGGRSAVKNCDGGYGRKGLSSISIKASLEALAPVSTGHTPVRRMTFTVYRRLAVAALIALLATVAGWLAIQKRAIRSLAVLPLDNL